MPADYVPIEQIRQSQAKEATAPVSRPVDARDLPYWLRG